MGFYEWFRVSEKNFRLFWSRGPPLGDSGDSGVLFRSLIQVILEILVIQVILEILVIQVIFRRFFDLKTQISRECVGVGGNTW